MTVSVQDVVDRAREILKDSSGIRWSDDEFVLWVNDAQREVVLYKPDAAATTAVLTLATGTKQDLPAAANRLLRVVRNMSAASGGVGGRVIRIVDREALDSQNPDWHDPSATGWAAHGSVIKHYTYDEESPKTFYVFPGVKSGESVYIEAIYSSDPTSVTISDNLSIADIYANAILDFVLYRAYNKESEFAADRSEADARYTKFLNSVGGKSQLDLVTTPNLRRTRTPNGDR